MPSLPRDLAPMLPARGEEPFDSEQHIFEVRWGGIRALAFIEQARLTLLSQSGRDITAWFPELAPIAGQVRRDGAVLDGEIVPLGADGEPDLALLSARLAGAPPEDGSAFCLYQAYDLLYSGGLPLMARPLLQRKEALAGVLSGPGPAVAVDYVHDEGVALFEAAAERRLPGVVAKAKASTYKPGERSRDWIEVPLYESGWFVIGGYVLGIGKEDPVAGLLLGEPALPGRLRHVATVQGGIPGSLLERALSALTTETSPFLAVPPLMRLVYWLRPELVCEVRYARREADGRLRFPVFVTMRPDLTPKDIWRDARDSAGRRP
ncbi:MAG TPA: DNA ligase [Dehalococcoidia bacterium]|nr:DNA ligase [Dehalococcoidia bacterium]